MTSPRRIRDVAAVLQARALALAQPEAEEARDTEALATFISAGHALGVPLDRVLRASELRHLTEIPDGPPYLLGLTTVEGQLVSLLDLAGFLGLPRRGVADVRGVLVVKAGERAIGLGAEQLLGIVDLPHDAAVPLPGGSGPLGRVARGRAAQGGDLFLLDVDVLLGDPRLGRERG